MTQKRRAPGDCRTKATARISLPDWIDLEETVLSGLCSTPAGFPDLRAADLPHRGPSTALLQARPSVLSPFPSTHCYQAAALPWERWEWAKARVPRREGDGSREETG